MGKCVRNTFYMDKFCVVCCVQHVVMILGRNCLSVFGITTATFSLIHNYADANESNHADIKMSETQLIVCYGLNNIK